MLLCPNSLGGNGKFAIFFMNLHNFSSLSYLKINLTHCDIISINMMFSKKSYIQNKILSSFHQIIIICIKIKNYIISIIRFLPKNERLLICTKSEQMAYSGIYLTSFDKMLNVWLNLKKVHYFKFYIFIIYYAISDYHEKERIAEF